MAGSASSGGGHALVCRESSGKILRAELLDLYEVGALHHKGLVPSSGQLEQDYLDAVQRTYTLQGSPGSFDKQRALESLRGFFKLVQFTQSGEKLPFVDDVGKTAELPAGCQLEQLAIFGGEAGGPAVQWGKIDSEIWSALNAQNQAALVEHEGFYAMTRVLGDKTSEATRAQVSVLFSDKIAPTLEGIPANAKSCTSYFVGSSYGQWSFYMFPTATPSGAKALTFQFKKIRGFSMLAKTTAVFSGLTNLKILSEYPYTVTDPGANYHSTQSFTGDQVYDWQVELKYVDGERATISLIREGKFNVTAPFWCSK